MARRASPHRAARGHLSRRRVAPGRDALRRRAPRRRRSALRDRQRLPRHARHVRRGHSRRAQRDVPQRLSRDVADRVRGGGVRLRQAGADDRRPAGREGHSPVRRRRAVPPADGDAGRVRAGPRHAGRHPRPHAHLGALVGPAGGHHLAAARLARAPSPGGDRLRRHAARQRRPRRHRVGGRRQPAGVPAHRRPALPAARVRGAGVPRQPRRRPAGGARVLRPVERHDALVRHRPRGADRLPAFRRGAGGGSPGTRRLLDRRTGRRADPRRQVHHLPLVAAAAGRRALPAGGTPPRPVRTPWIPGSARQPAALPRRLLASQRRRAVRSAALAAGDPLQPLPDVPGDRAGGGSRRARQGPDRPRLRGALLLGHRDLRPALPDLHEAAHRAEPAAAAPRQSRPGAATRAAGQSEGRALPVAHHQTAPRPRPTTRRGPRSTTSTPTSSMRSASTST